MHSLKSRQEVQKRLQCSYSNDGLFQFTTQEAAAVSKLAAASCLSQLNSVRVWLLPRFPQEPLTGSSNEVHILCYSNKADFSSICLKLSRFFSEENVLVTLC